jgi:hypothetical protein
LVRIACFGERKVNCRQRSVVGRVPGLTKAARRREPNCHTVWRGALQILQLRPTLDQPLPSNRTLIVERIRRTSVYGFPGQMLTHAPRGLEPPRTLGIGTTCDSALAPVAGQPEHRDRGMA